jgi:cyclophilin family peptidyl-prolyl cis-trans isomerase
VVTQKRSGRRQRDRNEAARAGANRSPGAGGRAAISRAAANRRRREQRKRLIGAVVLSAVLVLGVTALVSGGGGDSSDVRTGTTTTIAAGQPVALTAVPAGASVTGDTPCPNADGSSPRTTSFEKPPPMCIDPARTYTAEVRTSKGTFTIALAAATAPRTVNNFVVLARYHYYDGVPFHRIIPGFVVQGGDPTATGSGNPGYRFEDELPRAGQYKLGSVAMANSGPNTNGSQFFVVTGPSGASLQPNYSLFGEVTDGFQVVQAIEAVGIGTPGDPNVGRPTEVVTIESITIRES